ncbi:ATP-dependent Clp protease proteolytic subunit [uncultured Pantoea sp.]|uniref:ATP-dependent Clp protease proteolytic subunit n=1 Tax=uncultured Pantoea sp. TaxID=218084 RepID=UPI0025DF3E1F|nr:ATP-dependent Clp protease proteolytic subunit [uncultured Pantoea sp.]
MRHTVHFLCPVNMSTVSGLQDACLKALGNGATQINLHISSPGGELLAGFTAYHFLKSLPVPVHTHNLSNVESIATVIYLAGSDRRVNPGSRFLIHPLQWGFTNHAADHARIAEWVRSLDNDMKRFIDILTEETKNSGTDWSEKIESASFIGAERAVNYGLADSEIRATLEGSITNWWVNC